MADSSIVNRRVTSASGKRGFEYQADIEPVTAHIAAQYHARHGGSSFYVHGGNYATTGYAVGGHGIPETVLDHEHITPEEYQKHRDNVRSRVNDANAVAGTWSENGKAVMDASTVVQDAQFAKHLQIKRGERAVFNLTKGQEEDLR